MEFEFFDPTQEVYIHYRKLPHWEQAGTTYFVTWRTIDSIPEATIRRWRVERASWLRRHQIDPQADEWRQQLSALSRAVRREYHEHFTQAWTSATARACSNNLIFRRSSPTRSSISTTSST